MVDKDTDRVSFFYKFIAIFITDLNRYHAEV